MATRERKVKMVLLEHKVLKALLVPRVILEHKAPLALKELKAQRVILEHKVLKALRVLRVLKALKVLLDLRVT